MVKPGDARSFALSANNLVGLLNTMDGAASSDLLCGSHVDSLNCLLTLPDFAERKSQAILKLLKVILLTNPAQSAES